MIKGCIYFKGHYVYSDELERNTNHIVFEVENLSDIESILENNNVWFQDITIIDFRGF